MAIGRSNSQPVSKGRLPHLAAIVLFVSCVLFGPFPLETEAQVRGPEFKVTPLFGGYYRDGGWATFEIRLRNGPNPWQGSVRADLSYEADNRVGFSQSVELAAGAESRFFFYMLPTRYEPRFDLVLYNQNGREVSRQSIHLEPVGKFDYLIGVVAGPDKMGVKGLPQPGIVKVRQNDYRFILLPLVPGDLPDQGEALNTLDSILIGDLDNVPLNKAQQRTLLSWVEEGGKLWFSGGTNFATQLNSFDPAFMVARSQGEVQLDRLNARNLPDDMLPPLSQAGKSLALQRLVPEADARVVLDDVNSKLPLSLVRPLGRGSLSVTAFDLLNAPFSDINATNRFWGGVADAADLRPEHSTLRQSLYDMPFIHRQIASRPPVQLPDALWLLVGMLVYAVLAGLLAHWTARRLDRPLLTIVAIPGIGLGLGGLIWLLNATSAPGQVQLNRVALVQFYEGNTATVRSFGLSTGSDKYTLEIGRPAAAIGNPLYRPQSVRLNDARLRATPPQLFGQNGATSEVLARPVESDNTALQTFSKQDLLEASFPVETNLSILPDASALTGTITNSSGWRLKESVLVYGNNFLSLGELGVGESRRIVLPLANRPSFLPEPRVDPGLYGANIAFTESTTANLDLEQWKRNLRWITLNTAYLNGRFAPVLQNYRLYLTGWLEDEAATALLGPARTQEGMSISVRDSALLIRPLNFSYQPSGQKEQKFSAAGLNASRLSATNVSPDPKDFLKMGGAGQASNVVLQYRLPEELKGLPSRLTLFVNSETENQPGIPANPQLEIYNWSQQSWEPICPQGDISASFDLPASVLSAYIQPQSGFIRLRASTTAEAFNLKQLNLQLG
jgi:hypothetical protein